MTDRDRVLSVSIMLWFLGSTFFLAYGFLTPTPFLHITPANLKLFQISLQIISTFHRKLIKHRSHGCSAYCIPFFHENTRPMICLLI